MSRVGQAPITIPSSVKVELAGQEITVQGPKGAQVRSIHPEMTIVRENNVLRVSRPSDRPQHRALHGLTRALVANMVKGVSDGFSTIMELRGVGYRAEVRGQDLVLQLGYSHPIEVRMPDGIGAAVQTFTPTLENGYLAARLTLSGHDRQALGDFCADLRKWRPVEPYKGKGLRYANEVVRKKLGKAAKAGEKKGF